ncbi:uncharacterized protein [Neodiprion pinetum]|uniref:Uncharacterized protein LOC107219658 isoform X2 n=1 Tax=Neodiprion lecontei TaxID=441921 RepID=A0ABM3FQS0_NEOLC|nr:uncharacterized protein LOC124214486 isoform X2 [Neodiprion pinetum]XP_046482775.1 uncharacterized protein LOC124219365 isoform X2 [Neodiprion pinetum]XP_046588355.1 uncharacterized protein LOC124293087 isoform X2 [Neodiprion lecontei]XP_046590375.1 uncharacterized protein LOC107219658 isoform X2 [Neodiprion lecontei]XP_046591524.1 uncharacterized protein LOC124293672 isoform X2 [Neodiprion lecontei]XP_046591736.1 uncharacterized protein LOC124292604 isoform X2 [Neodiprion lecontei]XP_0466
MNNIIEKRRRTRDRVRRHRFVHQNTIVPQNHPLNDDSDSDINSETECVSDQENSNRSEEDVSEGGISEQLLEHSQSEIDEENGDSGDGSQIDHEESVSSASVIDENSDIGSSINEATDDSLNERNEAEEIRKWAIKEHLSHSQLDGLLVILRRRLLPELPKTAKTFLRTSAVAYDIQDMEDYDGNMGQFVYFGIAERLRACVNEEVHIVVHEPDIYEPVPVAIYAGSTKPKRVDEFLDEFIEEMNQLSANGIDINGRLFQVKIQSFICDTPARSFLKCVKGHTGYYACERCTVRGCRPGRSTVFPDADCPERSAEDFNRQRQREHHNSVSPLLRLRPAVNLVLLFILDFLHLACHGVMKKLLKDFWLLGNLHLRLGRRSRIELSRRMEYLKILVTSEFQRKPRSVAFIAKWKATEFRFFLLYCGVVVLKGILNNRLYKHFLLFHAACRILCCEDLALRYNRFAKKYLRSFFLVMRQYYGPDSQIMNLHNLIHMADDAKNMKCSLTKITTFPFENALGHIKKLVHSPNRPLAQICRRLNEKFSIKNHKATLPQYVEILKENSDIPNCRMNHKAISKLKFKGKYILSVKAPDNVVLLKNGTILEINLMSYPDDNLEDVTIIGKKWKIKESLYMYPCDSRVLEEWVLEDRSSATTITCPIDQIKRKMIILRLPGREKTYGISLLH